MVKGPSYARKRIRSYKWNVKSVLTSEMVVDGDLPYSPDLSLSLRTCFLERTVLWQCYLQCISAFNRYQTETIRLFFSIGKERLHKGV